MTATTTAHTIYDDGAYLALNPEWHAADSPWKAAKILKILRDNRVEPSSVAEIGCGAGEILVQLRQQMPEHVTFSGYDISPQAYALASHRTTHRLSFYQVDVLATETPLWDVMLCIDVFEHVEDYMGFLRALRDKARYTVFHIPLNLSAQSVFRGAPIMTGRRKVGHIHYFFKDTALATLEDTGYRIIDHFFTLAAVERPPSTVKNRLMRIPRRLAYAIDVDFAVRVLGGSSLMVLAAPLDADISKTDAKT